MGGPAVLFVLHHLHRICGKMCKMILKNKIAKIKHQQENEVPFGASKFNNDARNSLNVYIYSGCTAFK